MIRLFQLVLVLEIIIRLLARPFANHKTVRSFLRSIIIIIFPELTLQRTLGNGKNFFVLVDNTFGGGGGG